MRFQLPWSRQGGSSHTQSAKAETPTAAWARTGAQDVQNGFDRGWQVGVARLPQLGIGGEVGRECLPLRLAQPSGVGWGGSFHGLSSFGFGRTAYAMEAP